MRTVAARPIGTALLLSLIAPVAASAAELPRQKDRWIELGSANFTFISNAGEGRTRRIAGDLEQLRAVLDQLTSLELNSPIPTLIYIFKDDRSYKPYKHLYEGKPASFSGSFVQRPHANYITIDGSDREQATRTVYHEYVHYFAANNLPGLPLWFEEGLAELYQSFQVAGHRVRLGMINRSHYIRLHTSATIPIEDLMAARHDSPIYNEGNRQSMFYAQSWALVHYLMVGSEERRPETHRFIALISEGVAPDQAFRQSYSVDAYQLQNELKRYLDRRVFPFLEAEAEVEVDAASVVRALSYPEVLTRLGDLLAQQDDPPRPEAAEHFQAALAIDPTDGRALSGLGRLAERQARWDAARDSHDRAMAAAPDDSLVLFAGGRFMLRRGYDPLRARAALERSVTLDPSFGPAWASLAGSYLAARELTDEAVAAAETAHRLLPSEPGVSENLLRLYLYTDRRQQALQLIQRSFEPDSLHHSQALATVVRSDIQGARRRIGDGDPEGAEPRLLAAEAVIEGAAGESGLRQQIATLRAGIAEQRSTDRFNRATTLYNDGDVEGAREILVELQHVVPEGWHSDAVAGFLERIDDPEAGSAVEAPEPLLSEASRGEIDRLNELIARDEFKRALELLEDLEQRVDRSDGSWIDLKIRELRAVLSHNQFVVAYNRAVDQFNGGAYSTAIETLEGLLAEQPHAADADAARELLAEAREALLQQ